MVASRTLYDRAVALIRRGVLTEDALMERLSAGKRRVNRGHLRKVIARALAFTADEVHLIAATMDEEEEYGLQTA